MGDEIQAGRMCRGLADEVGAVGSAMAGALARLGWSGPVAVEFSDHAKRVLGSTEAAELGLRLLARSLEASGSVGGE